MRFDFRWTLKAGSAELVTWSGAALIVPDASNLDPDDWTVESLHLTGFDADGMDGADAEIGEDHSLFVPLMTWLLNTKRNEIEREWQAHVARCRREKEPVS